VVKDILLPLLKMADYIHGDQMNMVNWAGRLI